MTKTEKHWYRFGLRDLMFLLTIVGLILGWYLDHREQWKAVERVRLELQLTRRNYDERMDALEKLEDVANMECVGSLVNAICDPDRTIRPVRST